MRGSDFYSAGHTLRYGKLLNMVVGTRGTGKTTAWKAEALRRFREGRGQTVWVRRFKSEARLVAPGFLSLPDGLAPLEGFSATRDSIMFSKQAAVQVIPLSTSLVRKSADFSGVTLIVFDEFILPPGSLHYLPDEVFTFLELVNTVMRLREDLTAVLLGNHLGNYNPYYSYFDITVKPGMRRPVLRKELSFEFIRAEGYLAGARKGRLAAATEGTDYYSYAYGYDPAFGSRDVVRRRPPGASPMIDLLFSGKRYTMYSGSGGAWLSPQAKGKRRVLSFDRNAGDALYFRSPAAAPALAWLRRNAEGGMLYAAESRDAPACDELYGLLL